MQTNWIGKSRGLQFRFETIGAPADHDRIEVFTTRHDTLMGASFVGVSPDHPLAKALEADNPGMDALRAPSAGRMGTSEADLEKAEKKGFDTGMRVKASPWIPDWDAAGLGRELHPDGLRHRRDLSAARRMISAIWTFAGNTICR